MGDRSTTATMFVFLVSLLAVFAVLVNAIPVELMPLQNMTEIQMRTQWVPNIEIGYLNFTDSTNITAAPMGNSESLTLGDVHLEIDWIRPPYFPTPVSGIWFYHIWQIDPWGIFWEYQVFDDMPIRGEDLIEHETEDYSNRSYMILTCECQKSYYTYFIYNSTTYASWTEAYAGGELEVYVGMGWDDAIEKQNAWSLIWSIMAFNAPQVFGTGSEASVLNALIAIPLWASFAVTGAIMILWFIPLLGGE